MVIYLMMTLVGCGNNSANVHDTGITNTEAYQNYEKWEGDNQIRLIVDIKVTKEDINADEEISEVVDKKLPKSKENIVQKLREGIISFFQEVYQIDVSEKIAKQEVVIFTATGIQEGVMGYVDVNNPDILNLNERLLKEYSNLFKTTYIHETLHQIGFRGEGTLMIEEGITDALTDMICCYIGIEPVLTEYYFESRTLAYQILAVDPEIVYCYLEDNEFDIIERINEKLEGINQEFLKSGNLAKLLENRLYILYSIASGYAFGYSTDPYWFAFEAQEIVKAYCQACEPDASTIDYIRSHYLVIDYEAVSIFEDENGYGYYYE